MDSDTVIQGNQNTNATDDVARETEDEIVEPVINFVTKDELQKLCEIDLDFKICFQKFSISGTFSNNERTTVSKAIIKYLLLKDHNKTLQKRDFQELSQTIVKLFPTEVVQTYFIPSKRGKIAKGKLWDAYNNLRSALCACQLITRGSKLTSCDDHSIPENIVDNDVVNDDLKFLENYIEPWDTVVAKWRETVQTRRELKNLDPSDYMSKFPALLSARGYELFYIDIKYFHPTISELDIKDDFVKKVIDNALKEHKGKKKTPLLELASKFTDSENRKLLALLLLPSLFKITSISINGKKKNPSKAEVWHSFFPYFKNKTDRDNYTTESNSIYPSVHVFGDFPKPICVVKIANKEYLIDNPIQGFCACFHSFFVLDYQYPPESHQIWLFAQKKLFSIETSLDEKFPTVELLMKSL